MTKEIDFTTLSAYLDGELDESRAEEVEAQIANDSEIRALVRDLQGCDMSLRAALAALGREDPPESLVFAIDDAFAAHRSRSRFSLGRAALPIAASIIAVLATGIAGYVVFTSRLDSAVEQALQARDREQKVIATTVNQALETLISGKTASWDIPGSGSRGGVTPMRTYRSKSGHWCREYRIRAEAKQGNRSWRGLACRTGADGWITVQQFYYEQ